MKIIVWFRRDLRLSDNPALFEACKLASEIFPVFIYAPDEEAPWRPGEASQVWLHHSLDALAKSIEAKGSKLIIKKGDSLKNLSALSKEIKANAVFWNRLYEPSAITHDKKIEEGLIKLGVEAKSFKGNLLIEPWEIKNSSGGPFQVFTPYHKKLLTIYKHQKPLTAPKELKPGKKKLISCKLNELKLLPKLNWHENMLAHWEVGENAAKKKLSAFLKHHLAHYLDKRDFPIEKINSELSPHLHFGEISPKQIWEEALKSSKSSGGFLRQIVWREFAHHLLFHFPHTTSKPLREKFEKFPWKKNKKQLLAWQKGRTGVPIVDAGMRELWSTGIMHNRVRMIAASFLVKHLLQPWQEGTKWFWDTLVDADLANNTMGWQWVAGCGADAAPYFRIFNPVIQGEKFDASGEYVKRWIPELKRLPAKWVHKPWECPEDVLQDAGVKLGKDYPKLIIELAEGRERGLEAYDEIS